MTCVRPSLTPRLRILAQRPRRARLVCPRPGPKGKPYALANLVTAAVQSGTHPREWEASKTLATNRGAESLARNRTTAPQGAVQPAHGM
jgi:hypothetical protein